MRIAFLITRVSVYRLLGPAIDRALALGWEVECWHDYSHARTGLKGYQFPAIEACPRFPHGPPTRRPYQTLSELAAWLERRDVDVVVSIGTPQSDTGGIALTRRPFWVCLQATVDTFRRHTLAALEKCDLVAFHTPWWTEFAAPYYAAVAGTADAAPIQARLERRGRFVGFPEIDASDRIDPDEVRRRWGIAAKQPVVVLLPFPQGVGRRAFWPKKIFGEPRRSRRLLNVARHGKFEYWRDAWATTHDADVVGALRRFCDRNGACLLVKSREKTPIPDYARQAADKCLYDETLYPPTILEALRIADLCVSYYSVAVLEAAALGVPHLCVTYGLGDYFGHDASDPFGYRERFFNATENGVFQFRGVTTAWSAEAAIAELPRRTLDDFRIDSTATQAYVGKFVGGDGRSSERLLQAIDSDLTGVVARIEDSRCV